MQLLLETGFTARKNKNKRLSPIRSLRSRGQASRQVVTCQEYIQDITWLRRELKGLRKITVCDDVQVKDRFFVHDGRALSCSVSPEVTTPRRLVGSLVVVQQVLREYCRAN